MQTEAEAFTEALTQSSPTLGEGDQALLVKHEHKKKWCRWWAAHLQGVRRCRDVG